MKKLRLIVTTRCHKTCKNCVNNQFDIDSLPIIEPHDMHQYNEIYITGGEPMLWTAITFTVIQYLRLIEIYKGKIIIYTTMFSDELCDIINHVDGFTITLHDELDLLFFEDTMKRYIKFNERWLDNKSLRLNVFKGIKLPKEKYLKGWIVKKDIEWLEDCPLPEGEELKRLKNLI